MSEDNTTGFSNETFSRLYKELKNWAKEPHADLPNNFEKYLISPLLNAEYIEGLSFTTGGEKTYDITFGTGDRFVVTLWGNVDGCGVIFDEKKNNQKEENMKPIYNIFDKSGYLEGLVGEDKSLNEGGIVYDISIYYTAGEGDGAWGDYAVEITRLSDNETVYGTAGKQESLYKFAESLSGLTGFDMTKIKYSGAEKSDKSFEAFTRDWDYLDRNTYINSLKLRFDYEESLTEGGEDVFTLPDMTETELLKKGYEPFEGRDDIATAVYEVGIMVKKGYSHSAQAHTGILIFGVEKDWEGIWRYWRGVEGTTKGIKEAYFALERLTGEKERLRRLGTGDTFMGMPLSNAFEVFPDKEFNESLNEEAATGQESEWRTTWEIVVVQSRYDRTREFIEEFPSSFSNKDVCNELGQEDDRVDEEGNLLKFSHAHKLYSNEMSESDVYDLMYSEIQKSDAAGDTDLINKWVSWWAFGGTSDPERDERDIFRHVGGYFDGGNPLDEIIYNYYAGPFASGKDTPEEALVELKDFLDTIIYNWENAEADNYEEESLDESSLAEKSKYEPILIDKGWSYIKRGVIKRGKFTFYPVVQAEGIAVWECDTEDYSGAWRILSQYSYDCVIIANDKAVRRVNKRFVVIPLDTFFKLELDMGDYEDGLVLLSMKIEDFFVDNEGGAGEEYFNSVRVNESLNEEDYEDDDEDYVDGKKEDPERVLFRKWRSGDKEIIALFPDMRENDGTIGSFEHVGQHGGADYQLVLRQTTAATPEEYEDLKDELEDRGYNLRVMNRNQSPRRNNRYESTSRMKRNNIRESYFNTTSYKIISVYDFAMTQEARNLYYFYEEEEGKDFNDIDDFADYIDISMSDGDPDYLKYNGWLSAFESHVIGNTEYFVISSTEEDLSVFGDMIGRFFRGELTQNDDKQSWDAWKKIENGIAFRGGQGYTYAIYDADESPEGQTNIDDTEGQYEEESLEDIEGKIDEILEGDDSLDRADLNVEQGQYGQWIVSAIVDAPDGPHSEHKQYYDYTEEEAVNLFLKEFGLRESLNESQIDRQVDTVVRTIISSVSSNDLPVKLDYWWDLEETDIYAVMDELSRWGGLGDMDGAWEGFVDYFEIPTGNATFFMDEATDLVSKILIKVGEAIGEEEPDWKKKYNNTEESTDIEGKIDEILDEVTMTGNIGGYEVPLGAPPIKPAKVKKSKKKKKTDE